MAGNFKIKSRVYTPIEGQSKAMYDQMMTQAKKDGAKGIPSPVLIGHNLQNNVLSMKLGSHRFDPKSRMHLYVEVLYQETLTSEDLELLSNISTEPAIVFLVAFSHRCWNEMIKSYPSQTSNTVFKSIPFPFFDEWAVNQSLRNLKKL